MSADARPRSPYVAQRETQDGGFSRGWGLHFLPSEEGWIDIHNHLEDIGSRQDADALLDNWFARLDAYRLAASVMIIDGAEHFDLWETLAREDSRFAWIYWPDIRNPNPALVERAARKGAVALKLHNQLIMEGEVRGDIYDSAQWRAVFAFACEAGLPLLWHVTQRVGYSPYHGGGENAYWSAGQGKNGGITNEDLLQGTLRVLNDYPGIKIIGAHQLHIGLDRLRSLFNEYEHLYIDSSCGFYLRWADDFIESDRIILKEFVEKYADRVLYGTDTMFKANSIDDYLVQGNLCHARFMLRLGLEHGALQKVAWKNATTLFKLPEICGARRGCVRP